MSPGSRAAGVGSLLVDCRTTGLASHSGSLTVTSAKGTSPGLVTVNVNGTSLPAPWLPGSDMSIEICADCRIGCQRGSPTASVNELRETAWRLEPFASMTWIPPKPALNMIFVPSGDQTG